MVRLRCVFLSHILPFFLLVAIFPFLLHLFPLSFSLCSIRAFREATLQFRYLVKSSAPSFFKCIFLSSSFHFYCWCWPIHWLLLCSLRAYNSKLYVLLLNSQCVNIHMESVARHKICYPDGIFLKILYVSLAALLLCVCAVEYGMWIMKQISKIYAHTTHTIWPCLSYFNLNKCVALSSHSIEIV